MFGTIKKAMTAGAVVAVAALAGPAMASADSWDYTGPGYVSGQLTFTQLNGVETGCEVEISADLDNSGVAPLGAARGTATSVGLPSCWTTLPGCAISQTVNGLPDIETQGTSVTISGFSIDIAYHGTACSLNGGSVTIAGDFTGTHSASGETVFDAATGVSSSWYGPMVVDGVVAVAAEDPIAGGPDWGRMVLLT